MWFARDVKEEQPKPMFVETDQCEQRKKNSKILKIFLVHKKIIIIQRNSSLDSPFMCTWSCLDGRWGAH